MTSFAKNLVKGRQPEQTADDYWKGQAKARAVSDLRDAQNRAGEMESKMTAANDRRELYYWFDCGCYNQATSMNTRWGKKPVKVIRDKARRLGASVVVEEYQFSGSLLDSTTRYAVIVFWDAPGESGLDQWHRFKCSREKRARSQVNAIYRALGY